MTPRRQRIVLASLCAFVALWGALTVCWHRWPDASRMWLARAIVAYVVGGIAALWWSAIRDRKAWELAEASRLASEAEALLNAGRRPEAYRVDGPADRPTGLTPRYPTPAKPKLLVDETLGVYPGDDDV